MAPEVDGEREHAQAVVVGRALGGGEVARVVAEAPQQPRQVEPLGGAQPPRHLPVAQRAHPRRRRVEPALPRVDQGHELGAGHDRARGTTSGGTRRLRGSTSARKARRVVARERVGDPFDRDRDERRLGDAAGGDARGRVRVSGGLPHPPAPDVVGARGEDHVRDHAVGPLAAQERAQLVGGAVGVEAGDADGGEARVPQPLVGIEPERRAGGGAPAVAVEHGPGPAHQVVARQVVVRRPAHRRRWYGPHPADARRSLWRKGCGRVPITVSPLSHTAGAGGRTREWRQMSAQPTMFSPGRVLVADGVVYLRELEESDDEVVRIVAESDDPVAAVGQLPEGGGAGAAGRARHRRRRRDRAFLLRARGALRARR